MRCGGGEADVEQLLAAGHLERVQRAGRRRIMAGPYAASPGRGPACRGGGTGSIIIRAYDAARQADVALLAQQGLC